MKNELLTSKKFLAAISAIAIYVAGRFGFDLDPEILDHVFAALLVYVGAQGIADAGKSAAKIKAGVNAVEITEVQAHDRRVAGIAGSGIVCLIIALGVGIVQPACVTARPRIAAGVAAALDCNAPGLVGTFAGALVLATSAVESWISGDGTIDSEKLVIAASKLKSDQERCALATALAIAAAPTTPEPDAPASAPLEVDADAMRAAVARVKAQWRVVAVATEGGVI